MSIAEIHGKISSSGSNISDRQEDLLTSDVFGTFKYLVDPTALIKFLEKGKNLKQETPKLPNPTEVKNTEYHFWPRTASGIPDVIIVLRLANGEKVALMIEAKYFKALWDERIKEKGIDIKDSTKFLFYVTCSNVDYNNTLTDACKELYKLEEEGKKRIFWVSWNKATEVLEELLKNIKPEDKNQLSAYLLMEDLKKLLERKGLYDFKGFDNILNLHTDFKEKAKELLQKEKVFYTHTISYWTWLKEYEKIIDNKAEKIFYKEG